MFQPICLLASSGISCRTQESTRNLEPCPPLNPLCVQQDAWRNNNQLWFPKLPRDNCLEVAGSVLTKGK